MSNDDDLGSFFALPPFKADEALQRMRRDLKDRKPLVEQGAGPITRFTLQGDTVVELKLADGAIECAIAKKVSQRPEWLRSTIRSTADVRKEIGRAHV